MLACCVLDVQFLKSSLFYIFFLFTLFAEVLTQPYKLLQICYSELQL